MIVRLLLKHPAMYPVLTQNVDAKNVKSIARTADGYEVGVLTGGEFHHIPFSNVIEAIELNEGIVTQQIREGMELVNRCLEVLGQPLLAPGGGALAEAPETFVPPGIVSQVAREMGMDPYCIPSPPAVDNPHVEKTTKKARKK